MRKTSTLDDLDKIKRVDRSDMLSIYMSAHRHYSEAAKLAEKVSVGYPKPRNIIVAGMGGSAIGGELLKDWTRNQIMVPIEICREYSLPRYANKNTLVVVNSYSGETEESLSVFLDAVRRKCMVACVASGGTLLDYAEKMVLPYIRVPQGIPPRAALPYLFTPLSIILEKIGLISGFETEFFEAVRVLKKISKENSPAEPSDRNIAKTLASCVCGTVPVTYSFGIYHAAAQRFKTQFNENSKVPAKWEFFSELNHNEVVGWEKAGKLAKCFSVIFIRDDEEPAPIRRRIETTKSLLPKSVRTFEVFSKGKGSLARMLSVVSIGDFASVYLAVLRGVDPTPVKTITMLKKELEKGGVKKKVTHKLDSLVGK